VVWRWTADGGKVDKRTALGGKEAESGATEAFEAMLRATAERASKVKSTKVRQPDHKPPSPSLSNGNF
jgi:hypothetical protein